MKKAIILLSAIMSVMTLTVMADEYIDPQTNVVYTYEPGQPTASVKAGCEMVVDMGLIDLCPGSPDAADDVVILDKFTVGTTEYVVTSIGEQAFWTNNNIKSVSIPESVTDIGVAAFENCDGLTAVQLPEGLIRISRKLFHNCSQLESVVIPSSIRSIDEQAFADCRSLASLTLPADLNYIGRYAFQNTPWYSTQYNEAPDGLFYIGPLLVGYKGNVPTGDLVIKEGTTCIGYQAFNYCTGLTSVTIPESLTHVDYRAFYKCVGLTAVHLTDLAAWCKIEFQWDDISSSSNPLFYAHHLYLNGEEMTDLVIPDGVTSICRYAFDNCTGLTSVIIPEGVTRISSEAFRSCGNLTSVTIPPSMTTIGSMAFMWCENLNAVHISDLAAWCGISFQDVSGVFNYDVHLYLNGEEVKDLVIPDGVASIGSWSFMNCSYLTSVTIPRSVTNIGDNAFYGCSNLTDVYSYGNNVPSLGYDVFKNSLIASATLHVPAGSIEEYKTTSPWSNFGNIVALQEEPHQPQSFLEGNPIWVYKYERLTRGTAWKDGVYYGIFVDTGYRDYRYYFLGGQEEIDGKVYTMMGEVKSNGEGELAVSRWLPVREENGIVYAFTDSLPGLVEHDYLEPPYLQQGNECVLYNFNTEIGESLYPQNEYTKVESYGTYQLMNGAVCRVLKTTIEDFDLYEKLGYLHDGLYYGVMDPPSELISSTGGDVYATHLNAYYQNDIMLYKAPDIQESICVNDTCWSRDDGNAYVRSYKVDPRQEEVFAYIRQLQKEKEPVTFTAGQMATIILPTNPDASKGKYYRLDRYEDGQIIFEQELQPQAHIPYIIVPNEDFSIDLRTLDLTGLSRDTVSIAGISFIGSYVSETFDYPDGFYIDFIDITSDCQFNESCVIGALRAYLLVRWDDPYNQGGTRVPPLNKRGIVLRDDETGIKSLNVSVNHNDKIFNLAGQRLSKPQKGIYIENGKIKAKTK